MIVSVNLGAGQHSWTQLVELDGAKLGNFKFWSINYEMDAIDGVAFEG